MANVTPVQIEIKDFAAREVLAVNYAFEQAVGKDNQVVGIPRGGKIDLIIKAMNDGNNQLLQWKLNPTDPRDVKITFNNTVDGKVMKTISATGCYCTNYKEIWADGKQHQEHISIICQNMDIAGAKFENQWA